MEIEATTEGVQHFLIHSDEYVNLFYSLLANTERILQAKLPKEAIPPGLKAGDPITLTVLLSLVVSVDRREVEETS